MSNTPPVELRVTGTKDLEAIKDLSIRAGLEVREGPQQEHIACAFGCFLGERLVACAALEHKGHNYFVEWVAVDNGMRGRGLGSRLVTMVVEEARARGARTIWVKARIPGFYERMGFRRLKDDETGPISTDECHDCPQYHKNCFPTIMVRNI